MTAKLKDCPFCGSEAQLITAMSESWVHCKSCGASGPMNNSAAAAVECWNCREELEIARGERKEAYLIGRQEAIDIFKAQRTAP